MPTHDELMQRPPSEAVTELKRNFSTDEVAACTKSVADAGPGTDRRSGAAWKNLATDGPMMTAVVLLLCFRPVSTLERCQAGGVGAEIYFCTKQ